MVTVIFYTCNHTMTHTTPLRWARMLTVIFYTCNHTTTHTTTLEMGENGDSDLLHL